MVTLYYKPGSSVRCSSGSGLPGTGSPFRTPGRAGVREQSFCRVRGSSRGCHVSIGLQLWAVGLALVIMPGDLGVYAAESLSAASAPESAYTALGEMSRQRAGQWREQHGFLSDADFAYAFRSYEDAMAQAGTLVAEEWAVVRSSDTSGLYGAVASALDATEPAPRNPAPKRATTFMMRMASRGRAVRKPKVPAAEKPETASQDQVEALTEALHCLEFMKPRGHLTVALEKEWRAALPRKAAAKVREAEGATVRSFADVFGAPGPYGGSWSSLPTGQCGPRCFPLRGHGGAVSGPGRVEVVG